MIEIIMKTIIILCIFTNILLLSYIILLDLLNEFEEMGETLIDYDYDWEE